MKTVFLKQRIASKVQLKICRYKPQLQTRVKCVASRGGLGAALEQVTVDRWQPIAFISRFLKFSRRNV